jgi:hypothetical protein
MYAININNNMTMNTSSSTIASTGTSAAASGGACEKISAADFDRQAAQSTASAMYELGKAHAAKEAQRASTEQSEDYIERFFDTYAPRESEPPLQHLQRIHAGMRVRARGADEAAEIVQFACGALQQQKKRLAEQARGGAADRDLLETMKESAAESEAEIQALEKAAEDRERRLTTAAAKAAAGERQSQLLRRAMLATSVLAVLVASLLQPGSVAGALAHAALSAALSAACMLAIFVACEDTFIGRLYRRGVSPFPSLRERVQRFYEEHCPEKLRDDPAFAQKTAATWAGRERELFGKLHTKYSAKPASWWNVFC